MRRLSFVLVALTVTFALHGCSSTAPGSPTPTPAAATSPPDPRDVIAAAIEKSEAVDRHIHERRDEPGENLSVFLDVDASGSKLRYVVEGEDLEVRVIGGDFYLKTDSKAARPWMHIVGSKLKAGHDLHSIAKRAPTLAVLKGVTDVVQDSPFGDYHGKLDLKKALDAVGDGPESSRISELAVVAAEPSEALFTLSLDKSGRVGAFSVTLPSRKIEATVTYSADPLVSLPAANLTLEAKASYYK